jgi:phage-related tail fiber protein
VKSITTWMNAVGDASKLSVGIPTYCRTYVGAKHEGNTFDVTATQAASNQKTLYYVDLPATAANQKQSNGVTTAEGWTACVSPAQAKAIMDAVRAKYPDIGGSFVWELGGMSDDYSSALSAQ